MIPITYLYSCCIETTNSLFMKHLFLLYNFWLLTSPTISGYINNHRLEVGGFKIID